MTTPTLLAFVEHYTYKDWARGKNVEPVCCDTICSLLLGSRPPPGD